MQGEPRSGGFHHQVPRGVEFGRREDLEAIARVQDAMDSLRHRDERAWLATALFAALPAPHMTDLDRARIAQADLASYRVLVKAGMRVLRGRLAPENEAPCRRKRAREAA